MRRPAELVHAERADREVEILVATLWRSMERATAISNAKLDVIGPRGRGVVLAQGAVKFAPKAMRFLPSNSPVPISAINPSIFATVKTFWMPVPKFIPPRLAQVRN